MKYIALLRGINISGKNKISMSELKAELENNKYQNVVTYLNSGNIIFESNIDNKETIMKDINKIINDKFNLEIPVFIMTTTELEDVLNHKPDWWGTDSKEIYDNRLLVKIVDTNKKYNMQEQTPYENAKFMYLVDDIDNKELLKEIVIETCNSLSNKK